MQRNDTKKSLKRPVNDIVSGSFLFYVWFMWKFYNPNPAGARVGDCAVRAVSKALNISWDKAYTDLTLQGYVMSDMPSANHVWGAYLKRKGYERETLPNTCPDCYTLADFCRDYNKGVYVVVMSGHVATVVDGVLFDTWDSRSEVPIFYYRKEVKDGI